MGATPNCLSTNKIDCNNLKFLFLVCQKKFVSIFDKKNVPLKTAFVHKLYQFQHGSY